METSEVICCSECDSVHPDVMGRCTDCKSCLYKNGKQDLEAADMGFPIFICTKCGKGNFWD